jgi:hypothetical protein
MSNRTGRRRRTIPGYVSIEIASFRSIAASFKNDAEFGRWVKKAFDDMSIGCVLDDTDPRIRAIYTEAFDRMEYEYKRKKEWEERKNKEIAETEKIDEPKTLPRRVRSSNETKTPDQLVWGQFENVFLTQKQHDDFCVHVGNVNEANKIIDSLSCKLEDGSFNSSNHYATLMHWSNYRKEKAAEAVETAKARAAANAEAFGNVDRRTPYQKNQDELHQLYVLTSEKLKELK